MRENILGVTVNAVNLTRTVATMREWIEQDRWQYICLAPAHAILDCQGPPDLRRVYNASGLTVPDGMGVVWLLKLKGQPDVGRVYGPDLMAAAIQEGIECGWRHYLYGGTPAASQALAENLAQCWPRIRIVGVCSPPFRSLTTEEDEQAVAQINAAQPDIVWLGLGSPKQECWMAKHLGRVQAPVMVGVGAAFDFLSGMKRQAPVWVQRSGLEWLFRLCSEPRRLWRRYIRYPGFIVLVLAQWLGLRRYPVE